MNGRHISSPRPKSRTASSTTATVRFSARRWARGCRGGGSMGLSLPCGGGRYRAGYAGLLPPSARRPITRERSVNFPGKRGAAMARAIWNGAVLAESDRTVVVEGNQYFPPESVRKEHFRPSATHTTCAWKGTASYFDVEVGGQVNRDAAWYYPDPTPAAANIKDHVAFWRGVQVEA